ncbi:Aldo/keto reductase [Bimuria novae-zelandiae CBS 107.79]|uniref:Aldo/keto reductase n=1 Tax=Bimuria novae-zelandiae CBS 107.79 TaxID=1447943 RepID=A0A6A5VY01_9PLEO|nr:Aldo/keto reductase [Bimuria novae-zelandiae CBS 107.79]
MPSILGMRVGPIAFGMMHLTFPRKPVEQCFLAMRAALDSGCNFWNAGTFYGTPEWNSITLLQEYFKKYPEDADKVVLSVKACYDPQSRRPYGSPELVKKDLDYILGQLKGIKSIEVFECARVDPDVPVETTLKFIDEEYVKKGLVGGIALSEVSATTIRRAAKVTKIVAVENELSLWTTNALENGVLEACSELGIILLAYSPIGKGMLSGEIKTLDDLDQDDVRRLFPRFYPENFAVNIQLVEQARGLADKKGCTPAQFAINWVRSLSSKPGMPEIIPLPGSTKASRVEENATVCDLTPDELAAVDAILAKFTTAGARYPAGIPTEV